MSPPIRDGSGSSIGSIRLGDGSEISEVRTGAGDVLFSAVTLPPVAASDLVAWYPFRAGTGEDITAGDSDFGDTTDYSATVNGATFKPSGGVTDIQTGPNSGAFEFDGTDDFLSVSGGPLDSTKPFSLMAWFRRDGAGSTFQRIAGTNNNVDGVSLIPVNKSTDTTSVRVGQQLVGTSLVKTGQYFHLCLTFDGSTAEGYLNGSSFGSTSAASSGDPTTFTIGRDNSSEFFSGDIDNVRIYGSALSDSQINQIYLNTEP